MNIIRFVKNWTLPLSMLLGVVLYFVYVNIPFLAPTKPFVEQALAIIQPLLIFAMLFLSFCKIDIKDLRLCKWHALLLFIQGGLFMLMAAVLMIFPDFSSRILVEGAMLCMICPTATAAAVVTQKLNGNAANLITYTVLVNLLTAVLVPLIVPVIHPQEGIDFLAAFTMILGKVFPLLLCPFIVAVLIRHLLPKTHAFLLKFKDLPFYIWAVALTLAISVTVKAIVHSEYSVWLEIGLAIVSLITCAFQFYMGRKIGGHYDDSITAGQSLGQKNTVLAIWMGYTFFTPITSIVGGFYSVWHNTYNSYQLYAERKRNEA